jgi:hypothetical protein
MKTNFISALLLGMILTLSTVSLAQHYEGSYLYVSEYPSDVTPGWHEDVQGITHDDDFWYITQSDKEDSNPYERSLWKIPVSHDLQDPVFLLPLVPSLGLFPGISVRLLDDVKELYNLGYNHFGDLTYYYDKNSGEDFLAVAMERPQPGCAAIAFFRAKDLAYLGHHKLTKQNNAGWCAIDNDGYIYTSDSLANVYYKFELDWDLLSKEQIVIMKPIETIPFRDESNNQFFLNDIQGGAFSKSGDLLYLVALDVGIQVFDVTTGKRVQYSTNGSGYFNYQFDPSWEIAEEPEGLTIWDLDDYKAPRITGQLHVLMLDNDLISDDDVYFKHYTNKIFVDGSYSGSYPNPDWKGRQHYPLKTVTDAYSLAWDRSQLIIKAGHYNESLKLSKQIKLLSEPTLEMNWDTAGTLITGVGADEDGAGIAITNLDNDSRPEMIFMAYDDASGDNTFRYRIGWNLDTNGQASWDTIYKTVPGIGHIGEGAGVAITNLDSDSRPEMIFMAYDDAPGDNTFRYRIGWNLDTNGQASWDTIYKTVPGVGYTGEGAGVTVTNLDSDSRPEMIFMAYDDAPGDNTFRYRIGWNLDTNGKATSWDTIYATVPGVGYTGEGAGVTVTNLDSDSRPEMIFMAYDEFDTFRYKIGWNAEKAKVTIGKL